MFYKFLKSIALLFLRSIKGKKASLFSISESFWSDYLTFCAHDFDDTGFVALPFNNLSRVHAFQYN